MNKIKNILKKVFALVLGLLSILLILEIILRIAGFAYLHKSNKSSDNVSQSKDGKTFTILCLGDSHTYGFGVEPQNNYPSQLQELLERGLGTGDGGQKTFKVINKGIVTQNTTDVLDVLQQDLNDIHPDLVILLTGGANHWNYYGYNSSKQYPQVSGILNRILYKIRVYKLCVLLYKTIENNLTHSSIPNQDESDNKINEYASKIKYYELEARKNPVNAENYFYIGLYNYRMQNIEEAKKWFEMGIRIDPYYGNNYILLNYCYTYYSNDLYAGIKWLEEKIRREPNNPVWKEMIAENYYKTGNKDEAMKWLQASRNVDSNTMKIRYSAVNQAEQNLLEKRATDIDIRFKEIGKNPLGAALGFMYFQEDISKDKIVSGNKKFVLSWIKGDLEKIVQICRKNNVELLLQCYAVKPEDNFWTRIAGEVNLVVRDVANEYSVPTVDNEEIFKSLGARQKEYFTPYANDAHPNEKGYGLMAQNIYDKILSEKLLHVSSK
jgi:lysophospholipase L1-like esterase